MSDEQKALRACANYARLSAEVKRLTKEIALTLRHCRGIRGTCGIGADGFQYGEHDDESHLKHVFTPDIDDDGHAVFMTDLEIREYLSEHCEHCLAAYNLVLARKATKKSFGITKRAISAIGRAENNRGAA